MRCVARVLVFCRRVLGVLQTCCRRVAQRGGASQNAGLFWSKEPCMLSNTAVMPPNTLCEGKSHRKVGLFHKRASTPYMCLTR